jgi:hypothetical protein
MDSPVIHEHEERGHERDLLALLPHLSGSADDAEQPPEDMPPRKRIKSTPDSRCPVLENVAPDASREERVELLMKIIDMRKNVPDGCSIVVFQRPDKTYVAIYAASESATRKRVKKSAEKDQVNDKTVKKTRKTRPSQQQLMREEAAQLADAIAATAPGCVAPKNAESVVEAPPPPAPCGLGRGKGLMFANQDVLGMSRRVYGDTIPLVENPTPSGVIIIPDACACPCGCKSTESPAKSARLDLTSKKRACNICTLNQGRRMKACWDMQDEEVKRRIMEEEGAGAAEEPAS